MSAGEYHIEIQHRTDWLIFRWAAWVHTASCYPMRFSGHLTQRAAEKAGPNLIRQQVAADKRREAAREARRSALSYHLAPTPASLPGSAPEPGDNT